MTPPKVKPTPPAIALTVADACAALSVSAEFFRAHIESELRIVRIGKRKLVSVTELQRWMDQHGETSAHDKHHRKGNTNRRSDNAGR